MTQYWHVKTPIPLDVAEKLKELASNGQSIDNNILKVSASVFKDIFDLNRKYLYRGDCTAPADEQTYENNRNYITKDGLSGFSITPRGWVVSIFSNNKNNEILDILNKFTNSNSKVVVISNDKWTESHLILKYINKLGFKPVATTVNSTKWMTDTYGKEFMRDFTDMYGQHLVHVFLVKDNVSSSNTGIKIFESFNEAYNYTDKF